MVMERHTAHREEAGRPVRRRDPRRLSLLSTSDNAVASPRGDYGAARGGLAGGRERLPGKARAGSMFGVQIVFAALLGAFISVFWGIGLGEAGNSALARLADHPRSAFARFEPCGYGHAEGDCVIDGGSFRMDGAAVRLADVETPDIIAARCEEEAALGQAARDRLNALLNAGRVELAAYGPDDRDAQGRLLRVATINGVSVGGVLVDERLAHAAGDRRGWC